MGKNKRERTANCLVAEVDKMALGFSEETIQELNFRKLIARGVIVEESLYWPEQQQIVSGDLDSVS